MIEWPIYVVSAPTGLIVPFSADGRGGMGLEVVQIDPNIEHWNFVSPGNSDQGGPRKHVHTFPTITTSHTIITIYFSSKKREINCV